MIVKTDNPIVYSNAFGDGTWRKKIQGAIDKQKGEGGLVEKAKSLVGGYLKGGKQEAVAQPTQANTPPPAPTKKGMSKKVKIGLIVGGAILVIGIIAVIVIKSKNKNK
jgi:hypothetical protein